MFDSVLSQRLMYCFLSIFLLKNVWPEIFQSFNFLSKIHRYVKMLEVTTDFQKVSNFCFLNNHGLNLVALSTNSRGCSLRIFSLKQFTRSRDRKTEWENCRSKISHWQKIAYYKWNFSLLSSVQFLWFHPMASIAQSLAHCPVCPFVRRRIRKSKTYGFI